MKFWKKYVKDRGPDRLGTEMRIKIWVDPTFAALCLLYLPSVACNKGELAPDPDQDWESSSGQVYTRMSETELERWAATRSPRQVREAVQTAVRSMGAEEQIAISVIEGSGWRDGQIGAVARGVAKVGWEEKDFERLFPGQW